MRLDAVLKLEKTNQSDIKILTNAEQLNYSSVMAFVLVTEGGVTLGSDYLSYMISLVVLLPSGSSNPALMRIRSLASPLIAHQPTSKVLTVPCLTKPILIYQ